MKYSNNFSVRTVYIGLLLSFYLFTFWIYRFHIEPHIIIFWFFAILTLYYVMDIFNFDSLVYSKQDLLKSIAFNAVNALFFYVFSRSDMVVPIFLTIILMENMGKVFLLKNVCSREKVLIYGVNGKNRELRELLEKHERYSYLGYLGGEFIPGDNKLGELSELPRIIEEYMVDKVVVVEKKIKSTLTADLWKTRAKGVVVKDYSSFSEETYGKISIDNIDEIWLAFSSGFEIYHAEFQKKIKRALDIVFAIILGVLTLPIMLISAIIIKLESRGPVFFIQERIGYNNKPFRIIKLRSMRVDNEKEFENEETRITRFGKYIRREKIDELPQLWNILKGEMSFVGPRPEWDKLCYTYMKKIPYYNLRHTVKPGLTGWAQVKQYPYEASVEDTLKKFEYDLYYIKHQNLLMDIIILFKTLKTVFWGEAKS